MDKSERDTIDNVIRQLMQLQYNDDLSKKSLSKR